MATYNVSASAVMTDLETDVWGALLQTTDTVCTYNGATFTIDESRACLSLKHGESSAGDPGAGQRCGNLTVNADVTLTFDGNATSTLSGIKFNPTTTGAETKTSLLTIGDGVILTNSVGSYNVNNQYRVVVAYGSYAVSGTWTMKYAQASTAVWLTVPATATNTNSTSHYLGNLTIFIGPIGAAYQASIESPATGQTIPVTFGFITLDMTGCNGNVNIALAFHGSPTNSFKGVSVINNAGAVQGGVIITSSFPAAVGGNGKTSSFQEGVSFVQATEVTPADFALTNMQDGSVKATVSNIASIALTDTIVVFDSSNNRLVSLTRAEYAASSGRKDANCILLPGLALAANNGLYCKYTTDNFVYGPASGTANITPTYTPAVAAVSAGTQYGKSATEFTGTRPLGNKRFSFSC